MIRALILFGLALGVALAAGCGSARKEPPFVGPIELQSGQERRGEIAFMEHCNQCHPNGGAGLGPPLASVDLPGAAIRVKVRAGYPLMPAFTSEMLSDAELAAIIVHLEALKAQDDGRG